MLSALDLEVELSLSNTSFKNTPTKPSFTSCLQLPPSVCCIAYGYPWSDDATFNNFFQLLNDTLYTARKAKL